MHSYFRDYTELGPVFNRDPFDMGSWSFDGQFFTPIPARIIEPLIDEPLSYYLYIPGAYFPLDK